MSKIMSLEELSSIIEEKKKEGKKIVTTNGVFDILHVGHARYLREAQALGDILIVGVNTDESVKKNKGDKRPLVPEDERMEMLASLECVDYIFSFAEENPINFLTKIKPDVHAKGGDYELPLIEQPVVEENGGKVVTIPAVIGKSTTNLIEKIKSVYCDNHE